MSTTPKGNARRLQDLPQEFFPREKLIANGSTSLSNMELIALFLRTGTKGKNVLEVATELLQSAGSLEALSLMDSRQIASACKGVGMAKAATLAAAFELGGRAIRETVRNDPMNDPQKVYDFLSSRTRTLQQEKIFVLVVNTKMKLITCKEVSHGTLNESLAHPREIFQPALVHNGFGIILAHNHPSGNPNPSSADDTLTKTIKQAGDVLDVPLLDHIIIGKPSDHWHHPFYSYRRSNML